MYGLRVESIQLPNNKSLASSVVSRIIERSHYGNLVVVAEKPTSMLSALRRQWLREERRLWLTRAQTLGVARIRELNAELRYMEHLRFTAKPPSDLLEADVTVATSDQLLCAAPTCQTMIITHRVPKETLHLITSWIPRRGVVILYGQG